MTHDRIWYLLSREMANELLPEEASELEQLLQQHPDASYVKEVLMHSWKDNQKNFTTSEVEASLLRHKQRMTEMPAAVITAPAKRSYKVLQLVAGTCGIAAAVALLFLAGRTWFNRHYDAKHSTAPLQQLVTKAGSRTHIKLADGTSVWLNAGSKLNYPERFKGPKREVTLEGEAYFDVAKDADHPFIVNTTACSVRVLGTSFNVRSYADEKIITTSLVTGAVEVLANKKAVRLKPNEKLSIHYGLPTGNMNASDTLPIEISTLTTVDNDIKAETAWKDNKLAFKKMRLEDVAQRMEKWYGSEIHFRDEQKKELLYSGVFEHETLAEALKALEMTGGFHFTKDQNDVYWIE